MMTRLLSIFVLMGCNRAQPQPVEECPTEVYGLLEVSPDGACGVGPETWSLTEAWRTEVDAAAWDVRVGWIRDTDGDGIIGRDDAPQLIVATDKGQLLLDHEGRQVGSWLAEARRSHALLANVDGYAGLEVVFAHSARGSEEMWISLAHADEIYQTAALTAEAFTTPWLTDLDGDGVIEMLLGPWVVDLDTGAVLATLEGASLSGSQPESISGDLDRDGVEEILWSQADGSTTRVALYGADGARRAICYEGPVDDEQWGRAALAIGNLDDDTDGEFVAAGPGFVALCDTDGGLIDTTEVSGAEASMVGIGQLDLDERAELLVAYQDKLVALDDDLETLWTFSLGEGESWYPFTLADLDADGRHEVLVHAGDTLYILDSQGETLASTVVNTRTSWQSRPVVIDLDGDDRVEVVLAGQDEMLVVVENAEGGWLYPTAPDLWASATTFPTDRKPNGSIPRPLDEFWWLDQRLNVWNGIAVQQASWDPLPDAFVVDVDVCVEACDGYAYITAWLGNAGDADVSLWSNVVIQSRGDVIAAATLGSTIPPGVAVPRIYRVNSDLLGDEVSVKIVAPDECDPYNTTTVWQGEVCPEP